MTTTVRELTPTELQRFDPTRRFGEGLAPQRREKAWAKLPELRDVLQKQFGAMRVVVFGSLAVPDTFTHWSDIDLAVWGIAPDRLYEAVAVLNDLSPGIKVDLVDAERCHSIALKQIIQEEGIVV